MKKFFVIMMVVFTTNVVFAGEKTQQPTDEALDEAVVPLKESGKRFGEGTTEMPYRVLFTKEGIANGGCPGYLDGKGKFDASLAESQMRGLYAKGIRIIFSLVRGSELRPVIEKLKAEGLEIEHVATHLNTNSYDLAARNKKIFAQIAGMKSVYVHCRHGAHRAVVATTGALLKRGSVSSLGDAFHRAGGNLNNFKGRAYATPMLSQLIQYAKKLGIPVEDEFIIASK